MRRSSFFTFFVILFFAFSFSAYAAELVNINTADKATLMTLNGLGGTGVKAQAVIDYRTANGPFAQIEDIMNVSGIGTATFNNIKAYITVGGTDTAQTATTATSTQTQTQTQTQPNAPVSSYVAPPAPEIFADAGDSRTVIVGADVEFDGRAYNRQKEILNNTRFLWNFGDGATAEGPTVLHHFEYPGRYAVILTIAENKSASVDQIVVVAEPASLAFSTIQNGGVRIENRAGRDLDLSRWIVRQFGSSFTVPEHSVILAGASMFISQKTLGFYSGPSAELDYPNGVLALRAGESTGAANAPVAMVVAAPTVKTAPVPKAVSTPSSKGEILGASTSTPVPTSGRLPSPLWLSLGALTVLLAGGTGAVHYLGLSAKRPETPLSADEFDIVD